MGDENNITFKVLDELVKAQKLAKERQRKADIEVACAQKDFMAYDRDLKAARARNSRGRYRGSAGYKRGQEEPEDLRAHLDRKGSFRGGRGGSRMQGCFRCGDLAHRVIDCKKPLSK